MPSIVAWFWPIAAMGPGVGKTAAVADPLAVVHCPSTGIHFSPAATLR